MVFDSLWLESETVAVPSAAFVVVCLLACFSAHAVKELILPSGGEELTERMELHQHIARVWTEV